MGFTFFIEELKVRKGNMGQVVATQEQRRQKTPVHSSNTFSMVVTLMSRLDDVRWVCVAVCCSFMRCYTMSFALATIQRANQQPHHGHARTHADDSALLRGSDPHFCPTHQEFTGIPRTQRSKVHARFAPKKHPARFVTPRKRVLLSLSAPPSNATATTLCGWEGSRRSEKAARKKCPRFSWRRSCEGNRTLNSGTSRTREKKLSGVTVTTSLTRMLTMVTRRTDPRAAILKTAPSLLWIVNERNRNRPHHRMGRN